MLSVLRRSVPWRMLAVLAWKRIVDGRAWGPWGVLLHAGVLVLLVARCVLRGTVVSEEGLQEGQRDRRSLRPSSAHLKHTPVFLVLLPACRSRLRERSGLETRPVRGIFLSNT